MIVDLPKRSTWRNRSLPKRVIVIGSHSTTPSAFWPLSFGDGTLLSLLVNNIWPPSFLGLSNRQQIGFLED